MNPQLILIKGGIPGEGLERAYAGNIVLARGAQETLAEFMERATEVSKATEATFCIIGGLGE